MPTPLMEGVQRLETTARVTLAVLALASGVYTYLGVRDLLNGNATVVFFAAVIYSVAVSVGIYAFWTFLMRFCPMCAIRCSRGLLFGCMALGSLMIIAMSAWLNASALAGAAAIQQHLSTAVQAYTRDLDRAHSNALAAQGLLPDIQMAAPGSRPLGSGTGRFAHRYVRFRDGGAVAGADVDPARRARPGDRAVADRVKALYEQGGKHITKMRKLVSDRGPISARSDAFGSETLALMGVIASLQQTSVAPAVKRAADGLTSGFIAPAASGRSKTWRNGRARWSAGSKGRWPRRQRLCRPRLNDPQGGSGRAGAVPAALAGRGGAPLCRRFHPELGRGDFDRPDARRAGADPLRRACRDPPRRHCRRRREHHDGVRTDHGVAART